MNRPVLASETEAAYLRFAVAGLNVNGNGAFVCVFNEAFL